MTSHPDQPRRDDEPASGRVAIPFTPANRTVVRHSRTFPTAIALAIAGTVAVGTSAAFGAYPGFNSRGEVLSCFTPGTGAVRIVDHFPCRSGEQPLKWN